MTTPKSEPKKDAKADAGEAQVQKAIDAENAKGLRGDEVDPTPNEHYTVPGVAKGLPTPENSHPDNPAEGIRN